MNSLYEAIKNQDYWWVGIYEDVKNYLTNCENAKNYIKLMQENHR